MGSDDTPGGFSDPGPVTWKKGRKPTTDEAPPVRRRRPEDEEWEALAKQVEAELDDEDVTDEATELYEEVALDDEFAEVSDPEVVVVSAQVAEETFNALAYEPDADLDIDSEEVEVGEVTGLVPLDEPMNTEEAPELELDEPISEEVRGIDWRGLEAASVIVNLVPRTWKVLAGFWPILLLMALGGGAVGSFGAGDLWWILLFIGSGAWSTLIHYMTLRYRVHGGKLEIHEGLLNKRQRVIDPARIQNVGLVRNVFHRMTGLVEVRLETAGEARTEGLLSALSEKDAVELIEVLNELRGRAAAPEAEDDTNAVVRLGAGELLAFGLSRARVGVIGVLLLVAFEMMPLLSPEQTEATLDSLQPGVIAGLVLLAFALSWAGSGLLAVIRHHGFALFRDPDRLRSREGLLTQKKVEIPLSKIQLVLADEPLVRRWMGFGTLSVETAGLGSVQEGVQAAELTVPMVDQDELARVVRTAIPPIEIDPWRDRLAPAHPRALYRMIVAGLFKWTVIAVPCAIFLPPWGYAAIALPLLSIVANVLDYRYQGWIVTPRVIVARRGFWRRQTWILARDKIQSVHLVQGPLMRWHGLGRLAVMVAGSSVVLPDVGWPVAEGLLDELKPIPELELS